MSMWHLGGSLCKAHTSQLGQIRLLSLSLLSTPSFPYFVKAKSTKTFLKNPCPGAYFTRFSVPFDAMCCCFFLPGLTHTEANFQTNLEFTAYLLWILVPVNIPTVYVRVWMRV